MSEIDPYQSAHQVERAIAKEGIGLAQAITVGVLKVLDESGSQADSALSIPVPHKEGDTDE